MPFSPEIINLSKRLNATPDTYLRRKYLHFYFNEITNDDEKRKIIQEIISLAFSRKPSFRVLWQAFSGILLDADFNHFKAELKKFKEDPFIFLLSQDLKKDLQKYRLPNYDRALTLGERKSFARSKNIQDIDKVCRDPDESVIKILLQNPHLQERSVLLIASNKKAPPQVLKELLLSTKWNKNSKILRSIAFNPKSPSLFKILILPLLNDASIKEFLDFSYHQHEVRLIAETLLHSKSIDEDFMLELKSHLKDMMI